MSFQEEIILLSAFLQDQTSSILQLLRKYKDQRMDLADACVVRLAELMDDSVVITVDKADFSVYRRNGRQVIPLISPP